MTPGKRRIMRRNGVGDPPGDLRGGGGATRASRPARSQRPTNFARIAGEGRHEAVPVCAAGTAGVRHMRKEQRFHLIAMLIGFTALILFQLYVQAERVLQMPYSDFKKSLREGKVAEVALTGETIRGSVRETDAQGKET